jgi:sugar phosphate isomerase/epimerase
MLNSPTRRDVLKWTAAGALATALPFQAPAFARPAAGKQDKKRIPIALQLYSFRDIKDIDVVLKNTADLGFEGAEFAGYGKYANDAAGLKKKLDELGLKAAGTHIGAGNFVGDALKKTIEFHKTIGCKFLIVPGDGRFTKADQSKEYADFMNKTAEALKPEGLFTGHHNHTGEFAKSTEGDKTYWDLFAERTNKDVVLQQDMGHTMAAGLDPTAIVRKFPGRIKSTHIKNRPAKATGKKPFVGEDNFDWKGYITACYEVGGTEWFTIEQEEYDGKTSVEGTKISMDAFKAILKDMGK